MMLLPIAVILISIIALIKLPWRRQLMAPIMIAAIMI